MRTPRETMLVLVSLSAACHCAQDVETDTDLPSSSTSETSTGASSSSSATSESSTGEPFDASPWLGVWHYENPFLPFGEYGDPVAGRTLANFEIFADSRATMFYDDCSFDEPIVIHYEWEPDDEDGWLRLLPGEGETSLRAGAAEDLESVRVQRTEPEGMCRPQLVFQVDGIYDGFSPYYPGESCWVDRCTVPNRLQVDYCEGGEPPPCP
jgi:hypothetical protein